MGDSTQHPYRGSMPKPEPIALRVAGHLIQADSREEFVAKLRSLALGLNFKVEETPTGNISLTFNRGETVFVSSEDPCQPN